MDIEVAGFSGMLVTAHNTTMSKSKKIIIYKYGAAYRESSSVAVKLQLVLKNLLIKSLLGYFNDLLSSNEDVYSNQ
jgi:hypothetical protein